MSATPGLAAGSLGAPPTAALTPDGRAALTLAATPPLVPASVHVTDDTAPYPVTGITVEEIRSQLGLNRNAGTDSEYIGVTGTTVQWEFAPHRNRAFPDSGCVINHIGVSLRIVTTLPRWLPPPDAPELLERQWAAFSSANERHENGHRNIALHTAVGIAAALQAVRSPTCDGIAEIANLDAGAIWELGNRRQLAYDAATRHGMTQGSSWPPPPEMMPPSAPQ